jgi:hypothetical protein
MDEPTRLPPHHHQSLSQNPKGANETLQLPSNEVVPIVTLFETSEVNYNYRDALLF